MKRVFLIVLDSFGIGEMPDADEYGDKSSNTIKAVSKSKYFNMPNMGKLGLFNIDGVRDEKIDATNINYKNDNIKKCNTENKSDNTKKYDASYARMCEKSKGKDTTIGHWEIAGIVSKKPLKTFGNGFPEELIKNLEKETGRKVICNLPYSGTEVIKDYGKEHLETGSLIVYTSADSVLQIAAHEEIISVEELYKYCNIARKLCSGKYAVGRVIARPFIGENNNFKRTSNRHDYSLEPPRKTMLDLLKENGKDVIGVGKINDIFAGKGITSMVRTKDNVEGIDKIIEYTKEKFEGLCFINLVDFDMIYGHRNDVDGYAKALTYFDNKLLDILKGLKEEDILMITADHGCDPSTPSTDHSREYTPLIVYGDHIKKDVNLNTRDEFADIAASILEYFDIPNETEGKSLLSNILI